VRGRSLVHCFWDKIDVESGGNPQASVRFLHSSLDMFRSLSNFHAVQYAAAAAYHVTTIDRKPTFFDPFFQKPALRGSKKSLSMELGRGCQNDLGALAPPKPCVCVLFRIFCAKI
jgi:hypothetical protein